LQKLEQSIKSLCKKKQGEKFNSTAAETRLLPRLRDSFVDSGALPSWVEH